MSGRPAATASTTCSVITSYSIHYTKLYEGELFYTHNLGIPELREALAGYVTRLHRPVQAAQVAVTSAGVNALMLASQLLVDPGDRVVEVVPLWPNLQVV